MLADARGQTQLPVAGVHLNQAFNNALDTEATLRRPDPQTREEMESSVAQHRDQELGRRAVVAEPGGQTSGASVSSVALRLPKEYSSQTTEALVRLDSPNRRFYPR